MTKSLARRGFFTSEWWTTVIGGALSAALALLHIPASSATHVVAVVAPAALAGLYAVTRTMHKSNLASALGDFFPQATQGQGPVDQPTAAGQASLASAAQPALAPPAVTAAGTSPGPGGPPVVQAVPVQIDGRPGVPVPAAIAQTDSDFEFRGIPPIEDSDG